MGCAFSAKAVTGRVYHLSNRRVDFQIYILGKHEVYFSDKVLGNSSEEKK